MLPSFVSMYRVQIATLCRKAEILHTPVEMQVEKAPLESYADVGGLEQQVQEIKEAVELPLTHPELYEDIGIKPPKVSSPSSIAIVNAC